MITIGHKPVGDGYPVFVVAEIGINHNGSLDIAKQLIDGAAEAGVDAVKFQKRTPEKCVSAEDWHRERDTPWGRMTYIEYRRRIELGEKEYRAIDRHCRERGLLWFASCWDEDSVDFIEQFDPPCHKAASASLTDHDLLRKMKATGRPVILSTGMSTMTEMEQAIATIGTEDLLIAHSTSSYPCPPENVNLRMILTLRARYPHCPIGYSGHEAGVAPTVGAVALGATHVERHITLDRSMWGTDQAASVDLADLRQLVAAIREVETALGDGIKRVYEGELASKKKLRRVNGNGAAPAQRAIVAPTPGGRITSPTSVSS
jgi:N-acetylneuraminate synthase